MNLDHQNKRFEIIDFIRGVAVILMIVFHLFYDLTIFKFTDINFQKDLFWFWLPRLIVFLFMFSVGISMSMAHKKGINKKNYLKRLAKIGIGAVLISISTYFMYPKAWIYFGTLHCIFFTTILITPFLKHYNLSLALAITIYALNFTPYAIPFWEMPHASLDYIAIFPWIAVSFLGIFCYKIGFHRIKINDGYIFKKINALGRNAFPIYIVHQPILFSLVYLLHFLWPK